MRQDVRSYIASPSVYKSMPLGYSIMTSLTDSPFNHRWSFPIEHSVSCRYSAVFNHQEPSSQVSNYIHSGSTSYNECNSINFSIHITNFAPTGSLTRSRVHIKWAMYTATCKGFIRTTDTKPRSHRSSRPRKLFCHYIIGVNTDRWNPNLSRTKWQW